MQDPIHSAVPAIRVRASLTAALNMLTAEWREILKIILLPYIIQTLAWLPVILKFMPVMSSGITPEPAIIQALFIQNIPWFMLASLISLVIYAYLVTALVRFFILSERAQSFVPAYRPDMWRYLWRRIMVSFALLLSSSAVVLLTAVLCAVVHALTVLWIILGVVALLLVVSVVATRLGLAPIAAALGEDDSLSVSWQRTNGQVVRISMVWLGFTLVMMCAYLVSALLDVVIGLSPDMIKTVLTILKSIIVSGSGFAFLVALQTIVYVHFYHRPEIQVTQEENSHVL